MKFTREEIVETVIERLTAQGSQCANEEGTCMYSDPTNNHHCAIGFFLKGGCAGMYSEGPLSDLIRYYADDVRDAFGDVSQEDVGFLIKLQEAHDCWTSDPVPQDAFRALVTV